MYRRSVSPCLVGWNAQQSCAGLRRSCCWRPAPSWSPIAITCGTTQSHRSVRCRKRMWNAIRSCAPTWARRMCAIWSSSPVRIRKPYCVLPSACPRSCKPWSSKANSPGSKAPAVICPAPRRSAPAKTACLIARNWKRGWRRLSRACRCARNCLRRFWTTPPPRAASLCCKQPTCSRPRWRWRSMPC